MLTLAFTGDVMLGRGVNEAIKAFGPAYPWGNCLNKLAMADLRLINLECVITQFDQPWTKTPKVFFFRANPLALTTLKLAKIDFVSLANNHTLDFQEQGLKEMLKLLKKEKLAFAGAGQNLNEASSPAYLIKKGLKVGVLALTDNEPDWAAKTDKAGVYYLPIDVKNKAFERLQQKIAKAKAEVDILLLSAHWGPNMVERPPAHFQEFAHAVIQSGVDVFYGHSAHIFQAVEVYKKKLILYDTGDFVDDYVVDPYLRNDISFIYFVKLKQKAVSELVLTPVLISNYQVNLAPAAEANWALARMAQLCYEMNTKVNKVNTELVIKITS